MGEATLICEASADQGIDMIFEKACGFFSFL